MRKLFLVASILSVLLGVSFLNSTAADSTAPMIVEYHHLTKEAKRQANCLAENIYFEAGHESDEGKLAVAMVTLNRVASADFPDTICDVVHQKTNGVCQFSWYCEPSALARRNTIMSTSLYADIRKIAIFTMMNYETIRDRTKGALYYHANYVRPGWKMLVTAKIGNHIFYRRHKEAELKKEYRV